MEGDEEELVWGVDMAWGGGWLGGECWCRVWGCWRWKGVTGEGVWCGGWWVVGQGDWGGGVGRGGVGVGMGRGVGEGCVCVGEGEV